MIPPTPSLTGHHVALPLDEKAEFGGSALIVPLRRSSVTWDGRRWEDSPSLWCLWKGTLLWDSHAYVAPTIQWSYPTFWIYNRLNITYCHSTYEQRPQPPPPRGSFGINLECAHREWAAVTRLSDLRSQSLTWVGQEWHSHSHTLWSIFKALALWHLSCWAVSSTRLALHSLSYHLPPHADSLGLNSLAQAPWL